MNLPGRPKVENRGAEREAPAAGTPPRQLLALLDDAVRAGPVIEMSSALAAHLGRPLEVVYVQSTAARLAAALPFARVLAPGGDAWQPLAPDDVELGYRAHAARLRALVERLNVRRTVEWSMRVVRGALDEAALGLQPRSDLMLVGSGGDAPALLAAPRSHGRPRRVVSVIADESAAGQQARSVARQVALALEGVLVELQAPGETLEAGAGLELPRCELLVLPRTRLAPALLARLLQPALLVG